MVEAMSCGTPVIGTRWSGPAVFLTEANGYPLRTDGLVPNHAAERYVFFCCLLRIYMPAIDRSLSDCRAAPDPVDGSERPHYWALPSVAHLRERLRQAMTEGAAGRRARYEHKRSINHRHVYIHLTCRSTG